MPAAMVRQRSLANHMALVACGTGGGLRDSFMGLIRLTYLSFFLWEAGYGNDDPALYLEAERTLDQAALRAEETDGWRLTLAEHEVIKNIVCEHDQQLSTLSLKDYFQAVQRLEVLLNVPRTVSPIQQRLLRN